MAFCRLLSGACTMRSFGRVDLAELDEAAAQLRGAHQGDGQGHVAIEFELRPRLQARGGARMTGHEYQLIGGWAGEIDLQDNWA